MHQYDIGKCWDQRLRHHYKDRYDQRLNMVDWDYNMYIKTLAPHINQKQYKQWRHTGLAFEWRLAENKVPNRTFGSYLPAYNVSQLNLTKQKKTKDNIEVRGFWGDILQSPYIPFGTFIYKEPEASTFFKQINF